MEALAVTHEDDPALAEELAAVGATLHEALGTVRASVHDLHDEAFDPQTTLAKLIGEFPGIIGTLAFEAESLPRPVALAVVAIVREALANARTHGTTLAKLIGEFPGIIGTLAFEAESLPRPVALAVVAIVREALANARTHGRATSVAVSLLEFPGFYQLAIEDNGRAANLVGEGGLGLASMEERATALGGTFSFGPLPPPRTGSRVFATFPKPHRAPAPASSPPSPKPRRFAHERPISPDIRMPDLSGLAAGEAILAAHPKARIVFLTTFADDDYIVRALAIGARGYLIKQEARGLAEALHSVMEGQIVLGSDVTDRVSALIGQRPANGAGAAFDDSLSHPDNSQATPAFAEGLTQRERDIAELIAEGFDNREIAQTLFLSEGTVRNHISAILQKCGLRNRTQIAIAWWR